MADGVNYTGDFPRYVLDRLFDKLTDKSYRNAVFSGHSAAGL